MIYIDTLQKLINYHQRAIMKSS